MMAVAQTSDSTANNDFGREGIKSFIRPEDAQRIKENNAKIKAFLNKLSRGRARALVYPLLVKYDASVKVATALYSKAKSRNEKKMADQYMKTANGIIEKVIKDLGGKSDINEYTQEDFDKIRKDLEKTMNEYKAVIKQKGKNSIEYAIYRAYYDYLKNVSSAVSGNSVRGLSSRSRTTTSRPVSARPTPQRTQTGGTPQKKRTISRAKFEQLSDKQKKIVIDAGYTVVDS